MDQRDQELLAKQLRAITPAPPRDGAIIVIIVMAFLAGMALAACLLVPPASRRVSPPILFRLIRAAHC
jgi:hypothetical protein